MLSVTVWLLVGTVCVLLTLTGVAVRYRRKPGVKLFGALQALSVLWASLTAVGLTVSPGSLRLQIWGLTTALSLVVTIVWFAFILSYTGRSRWLSRRRVRLALVPLAFGAAVYAAAPAWRPLTGNVTQEVITAGTVVRVSLGSLGAVLGLYIYAVFLFGLALVIRSVLKAPDRFAGQGLAFALGSLVTIVASFLAILGVPTAGYPLTQVALGGQSLLYGYAVFGQQFIQVVPTVAEIGEQSVFENLDDGVLVIDTDGTVTQANPRACSYLDVDDPTGRDVDPFLDRMEVTGLDDLPTRFRFQGRTYRTKASPVQNWRDTPVGHALVVQDITPLVRRQQRLQVLNRILRHNVRNEMNVVLGIGEQLEERSEAELAEMGETLHRKADSLVTVSEKALEIDRLFDDPRRGDQVDLQALVADVVPPLASAYPDATVETTVQAGTVQTDSRILAIVLEEVVENALEHAGEGPNVEVTVERRGIEVALIVSDDGPGIPKTETDPIISGEESDLEHASSLGLWLVWWGTQTLGGTVDVTATERGSTVTLTVPDWSEAETAEPSRPPRRDVRPGPTT
jgi:signal transduction histidine kinase